MNILEFGSIIKNEVMDTLGSSMELELKEIIKNNGIARHALIIRRKGDCVAPTIYLDKWFEEYCRGRLIMSIVGDVIDTYRQYAPAEGFDMSFFTDFSKVSKRLFFKLVNYAKNEAFLADVPNMRFEDLSLVPLCSVPGTFAGDGVVVIKNGHLKAWEISDSELWENVYENASLVAPYTINGILECLGEKKNAMGISDEKCPMYVLSNSSRMYGAAVFLYPGVLKEASKRIGGDVLIIPSSVHEVIVMPYNKHEIDVSGITSLVKEINVALVDSEEVLSDNVYFYDAARDKVSLLDLCVAL